MNCQQFELYRAESESSLRGRALTLAEAQVFVNEMRETPWWIRHMYDDIIDWIDVIPSRKPEKGSVGHFYPAEHRGVAEMAPEHLNELYVCHEVAHILARARYGSTSHDPWFASTYLELVYTMMGPDAYAALRERFVQHGIDFTHDSTNPAGIQL